MIGKRFAHYDITTQPVRGGMGEVYRAKDRKFANPSESGSLSVSGSKKEKADTDNDSDPDKISKGIEMMGENTRTLRDHFPLHIDVRTQ